MRKAEMIDFEEIKSFYLRMIEELMNGINYPLWEWGVHPEEQMVIDAIEKGELMIEENEAGEVIAAGQLNSSFADGYDQIDWKEPDSFAVIHLFGVRSDQRGTGLAARFLQELLDQAKEDGAKALRLDLIDGNEPARRLYLRMGFESRGKCDLKYDNEDPLHFEMMEKVF